MHKAIRNFLNDFMCDLTWRWAVNNYFNMVLMFILADAVTETKGDK
jgi:hypothetical protein